ncbi:Stk1 family PASTA domain-containing Ser/Thr kinase [Lederbergia lenta]|uniref:Serine/threonine-protein kinase PrkC n=1 Tax=Lederbergia lenta TaxID=1467 RepID=A0A2X4W6T5_LEDLE|nr:Stk1 family PASTA domain-containing Ser/Thr kinase [Lederbergia lenta]MEC2324234.1 Stk1 family PASTA domain-containing Ser/Thr kinase [Lederbergia lenta]SQI60357.1 serine/threonine protein kinase with PASTA sensor(s) [Lederbergia lenta]
MLIGRRISGRYKILRMIGGGGMANVYLAHDIILEREVAVKVLRLDFATEDEFIRRFQREAQAATSLNHENIVNIFDVGEESDIYYIVMEYVDGMTLKQFIQQNHPVSIEKTIDIMKQLTSAVDHAHQNHIVHRDIKPQNILIDHDGHVMITDFGIAMALSSTSITKTNAVLGSVHYLSPEQARGGMATKKSDIYSIGIVMFELLTGRLPFSGESAVSIALKHLQSDTPSPSRWNPDIPQSVENIVLKATAKDPFLRYETTEEMGSDLESALNPERINEPKFVIPEDMDATKAIPVIVDHQPYNHNGNTVPHEKDQSTVKSSKDKVKQKPKKKTKNKKGDKTKRKKKWPWIIGSIIMLLLLSLLIYVIALPAIFNSQNVPVPDVSGEDYDDAVLKLVDAGLVVDQSIDTSSEEFPEGVVIKTDPKANNKVKKGSTVNVYISSGKEKFRLSDYRGKQFEAITQLLDDEGFQDITSEPRHDDSPAGTILEQEPGVDVEVVPEETTLNFIVSAGEEKITLKDLQGNNIKGLESYEESSGLQIDMSSEEFNDNVDAGLVISQDPAPGTELTKGSKVKVVISKGQEAIPPKTVTKEINITYEPKEPEAPVKPGEEGETGGEVKAEPQEIKIFIEDMNNSMTVPAKTIMIEGPVTEQIELTVEKGKKAGYKVVRDNEVIIEEEVEYPED